MHRLNTGNKIVAIDWARKNYVYCRRQNKTSRNKLHFALLVLFIILWIGGFVTSADKLLRHIIQCFQDNLPLILGTGQKLSHEMLYLLVRYRTVRIKQLISRNA